MTRPDDTTPTPTAPVEGKVTAQWIGHALGLALAGFVSWALGVVCWHAPADAAHAPLAAAAVPAPVLGLVALIPLGVGFLFGYRAKHSPRPIDLGPAVTVNGSIGALPGLADAVAQLQTVADRLDPDHDDVFSDGMYEEPAGARWGADGHGNLTRNPMPGTVGEQGPTWATVKDGKVTPIGGTTAGFPLDPDATGPIVADVIGTPNPADTSGT